MARGYTTRKLEVYSLNARTKKGPIEYRQFFTALSKRPPETRQVQRDDNLIALPHLKIVGTRVHLIAYEGPVGIQPLIFDAANAQERIQRLRAREVVATRTHCVLELASRDAIVEYNHRGAKAVDIAHLLVAAGQSLKGFGDLQLELNPKVSGSFLAAIGKFGRIRVASLRVARPNIDWSDHYNSLNEVAQDSNAHTVTIEVTAGRRDSLSRTGGVISYIRQAVGATIATLRGARVTGVRDGESAETTVTLNHFFEHQKINVRMTTDGHVDSADIEKHMIAYLASRAKREGDA